MKNKINLKSQVVLMSEKPIKRNLSIWLFIYPIKIKDEFIKFVSYWEEKWFLQIKKDLYDFCNEIDGEIVNQDLAESIVEDYILGGCQYAPISHTLYQESLVTIKKAGVFWHSHVWDGIKISSLSEQIKFFVIGSIRENIYWKMNVEIYIPWTNWLMK